ncbi:Zinc finger CW-type PWWP domain protein 1, partial [Dufourea novaeangliae]
NNMQNKKFLFERPDSYRQTPTMLFKKSEFGQVDVSNISMNLLPQFNLFHKRQFDESTTDSSFFTTPPMEKKSVVTPKAPIKNKKQTKRVDLKPKKLQYTDEDQDSGIHIVSDHSSDTLFRKRYTLRCNRFDSTQKEIPRLRTKLDKIKVQSNDKENDKTVIGSRCENLPNTRNNVSQVSSVVFDPNTEVISQCNSNLDWKQTLHWLQSRRDVGLWIECCRRTCKKLRYVQDVHDPTEVPKIWYCEMNSDKSIASCNIPEQPRTPVIDADLIENSYNAGSIVWAHVQGFPWWPGIVNDCPETFRYYELPKRSHRPVRYYVTFFSDDKLESAWLHKRYIKPFAQIKYSTLIQKTKFDGTEYKSLLDKAYELALSALPLSILERLQKFSYVALYKKLIDVNNINESVNIDEIAMDTNSDDEIPPSNPTKDSLTLKEYYLTVLRKR